MLARTTDVKAGQARNNAAAQAGRDSRKPQMFQAEAAQIIRQQASEIVTLSEAQSEIFAAMLAELDCRIDDICVRTDRLLAQHS